MTATILAALALAVVVLSLHVTPLGLHYLSLQLGGANDPTPTPVCDSCVPDEEQPPRGHVTWLPWGER